MNALNLVASATTSVALGAVLVRYVLARRPIVPGWILLLVLVSAVVRVPRAVDEGNSLALVLAGVVFGLAIAYGIDEGKAWRYRRALARSIALHPSSEAGR